MVASSVLSDEEQMGDFDAVTEGVVGVGLNLALPMMRKGVLMMKLKMGEVVGVLLALIKVYWDLSIGNSLVVVAWALGVAPDLGLRGGPFYVVAHQVPL